MINWKEFERMMNEAFNSPFDNRGWDKKTFKSKDGLISYTIMSNGFGESPKNDELSILRHNLDKAVEEQNFEEAVKLRDKIKNLEKNKEKISELESKLQECVKNQDYEKAIEYRDKIKSLK
jgi:protein-arginine kinase activator protein McsA